MLDNVMARMRKPLSVTMAALLVALLVPILPDSASKALAEETPAVDPNFITTMDESTSLVTSGIWNNHAASDVTFTQKFETAKIRGKINPDDLTKPTTVGSDDATLLAAATSAADAAVAKVANGSREADAQADIGTKKNALKTEAETAAMSKVTELLAKTESKTALEDEAKRIAQEAHPDAEIGDVTIKTKPDVTPNIVATLGEPTLSAKDIQVKSASASNVAFSPDSLVWVLDEDAFGLTLNGVLSSNEDVVTVGAASGDSLVLTVQDAGTTTMSIPYQFNWKATGGKASYDCSYSLDYTPQYSYDACTYAYDFTYSWTDEDGTKTENVEGAVSDFSLNEKPAGDLAAATATPSHTSIEIDFASDYTPDSGANYSDSYTYSLAVTNLFTDASVEERAHAFTSESDNGAFTYHDGARNISAFAADDFIDTAAALSFLGDPAVTDKAPGFDVAYDKASGNLTVTPVHATAPAGESVTLTWTLPDGTSVIHTVAVVVNPFTINYAVDAQPFLLEGAQQARVLKQANDNVRAAIKTATGDDIAADYYQAVSFAAYDGQGAGQEAAISFTPNADAAATYANYAVVDLASVVVKPMEQPTWKDTGLSLTATNGSNQVILTSNNAASQWINSTPTALWDGHRLAYATKGVPASDDAFNASVLSGGDGVHDVTMYAMDKDGVVCEITGITYLLDTLQPVLQSAEASAPQKSATFGGILFGDSFVNVNFAVVDRVNTNQADSKDTLSEVKASGVNSGQTTASYTDTEHGQADIPAQLSGEAPLYSFTIAGDKDVPANSIKVHAVDNAGNVLDTTADQARDIPMEYIRLVSDAAAPTIAIDWDTYDARNGHYYQTNRTMTITIEEAFFNYVCDYENDQVVTTISQNGEAVIAVHPSDFTEIEPNVWTYSLAFTTDADWDVSAPSVHDILARNASVAGDTFTVDKTNPTMEVSFGSNGSSNGKYYSAARTATVTVTEHNFSGDAINVAPTANAGNGDTVGQPVISGWASSGDVHTATVTFPGEGVYAMTIDGRDLADNVLTSYSSEEFVVDTVKPQIDLSGINGERLTAYAYDEAPQPSVTIHDTNVDTVSTVEITPIGLAPSGKEPVNPYQPSRSDATTDVTVQYNNPDAVVENDGVYSIVIQASDLAGNTDSKTAIWSVNRFGSTYMLGDVTEDMLDNYLKFNRVKDVVVTEINPSALHDEMTSVEVAKGGSNSTLDKGSQYTVEKNDTEGWHSYTYTVKRDNFNGDGTYQVTLHSQDDAANVSENTMANKNVDRSSAMDISFFVDDTKPFCGFVGLESDGKYQEDSHNAQVTFNDNMRLEGATVKATDEDGNITFEKSFASDELSNEAVKDIVLPGSDRKQTVSVSVVDSAGNQGDVLLAEGVTVSSNPLVLWRNNEPLFVGTIAGGVVVLVGAGVGVGYALRKRKGGSSDAGRAA